jgi:8-oxo-dGTP pyrophosphatase MutT (NUDIX family)
MTSEAAAILITVKDCVLLCKRIKTFEGKPVPFGGYWAPFSGIIEEGETPKECAIRELKEESGLIVAENIVKKLTTIQSEEVELHLFICELDDFVTPNLCKEHTEFGFFDINKLHIFPEPIDERIAKCLIKSKKIKKKLENYI